MRYANYRDATGDFVGVVEGEVIRALEGVPALTGGFDWGAVRQARLGEARHLSDVRLLSPVLKPDKIICLGLNYTAHVAETGRELPSYPVLFTKFASAVAGPFDAIELPPESTQIDYEAELAVVIGRTARRIRPEQAEDVIAGFTIANDITMRDYQYKSHQWLQGKTWPRSTPVGPWLVTGDEIGGARDCTISLTLNGERMQAGRTSSMIFDISTTVALLSEFTELAAGDVILTGTPDGVGFRREPKVLLTPGDVVRVEIEGIGAIENQLVAEDVR